MFYPSLFPACNEINATLICITLLLSLGVQNKCDIVWLQDTPENNTGLQVCALTDL